MSTAGVAENLHITDSSPKGTFDAAAISAVKNARFVPGKLPDGTPARVRSQLQLRFSLRDR